MTDVVVLGGGMAGCIAALELARGGAKVALSRAGWGATTAFNGAFEMAVSPALTALGAATPWGGHGAAAQVAPWTLQQHIDDVLSHEPLHPYSVLGKERVISDIEGGYRILQKLLHAQQLPASALDTRATLAFWPKSGGSLAVAAATLHGDSVSPFGLGLDAGGGPWGILDLSDCGLPQNDRTLLGWLHDAKQFGVGAPHLKLVEGGAIDCGGRGGGIGVAQHLDDLDNAHIFSRHLKPKVFQLRGLIVPPAMGLHNHHAVMQMLQQELAMPVIESLAGIPSVPGVRLMRALQAAVSQAGIRLVSATRGVKIAGDRVTEVQTEAHGTLHTDACVLATGRFWAGGLQWAPKSRCTESLFGLPLMTDSGLLNERSVLDVTGRRPEEPHKLMSAGVATDASLRPITAHGSPLANVRAAGMVLGGFTPRYSRCADGVALATAYRAATDLLQMPATKGPSC